MDRDDIEAIARAMKRSSIKGLDDRRSPQEVWDDTLCALAGEVAKRNRDFHPLPFFKASGASR